MANEGYNPGQGGQALALSSEESLVIQQLRQLHYGEVVVEKKAGKIVYVRARRDIKLDLKVATEPRTK